MRKLWGKGELAFLLLFILCIKFWPTLQNPELRLFDALTQIQLQKSSSIESRVAVVDIDEPSLSQMGRWPWSRQIVGQLLQTLLEFYEVSLVGVDILFVDKVHDDERAPAIFADPRVVHSISWSPQNNERKGQFMGQASVQSDGSVSLPVAQGWLAPDGPEFGQERGHISPRFSGDGVVRQMSPLVCSESGQCLESMGLALYRKLLNVAPDYQLQQKRLFLSLGPQSIPINAIDQNGLAWLSWVGLSSTVQYVSAVQVLNRGVPLSSLSGKVVLIGSTSTGLYDQVAVPFSSVYPAVEVHRNQLSSYLNGDFVQEASWGRTLEVLIWIAIVFLLKANANADHVLRALVLSSLVLGAHFAMVCYFHWQSTYLSFFYLYLFSGLYFIYFYSTGVRSQIQFKKHLIRRFGSYVAPQVINRLVQNPQMVSAAHEKRLVTILFADVHGYTKYAEATNISQVVQDTKVLMNEVTRVILKHGGAIDKYMGDSVMALWGAPISDSDQAQKAFDAAVEILGAVGRLNQTGALPNFRLGVGLNTGEAIVGDLGSDFRYDYSVLGSCVNVASALEKSTRSQPYDLIVGASTFERCQIPVAFEPKPLLLSIKNVNIQAFGISLIRS